MARDVIGEARRRWTDLRSRLGVRLDGLVDDLIVRHAEPHRSYHTLEHVLDVLAVLDGLDVEDRETVELAAWFHDAVYDPRSSENEAASARLAHDALGRAVGASRLARVEALILATARHESATDADTAAFLDADLAILGAAVERYDAYSRAIREEFAWVPQGAYREGRSRVLRAFLDRPLVYATPVMRERHEAPARENMRRELASLSAQTLQ